MDVSSSVEEGRVYFDFTYAAFWHVTNPVRHYQFEKIGLAGRCGFNPHRNTVAPFTWSD